MRDNGNKFERVQTFAPSVFPRSFTPSLGGKSTTFTPSLAIDTTYIHKKASAKNKLEKANAAALLIRLKTKRLNGDTSKDHTLDGLSGWKRPPLKWFRSWTVMFYEY